MFSHKVAFVCYDIHVNRHKVKEYRLGGRLIISLLVSVLLDYCSSFEYHEYCYPLDCLVILCDCVIVVFCFTDCHILVSQSCFLLWPQCPSSIMGLSLKSQLHL